MTLHSCENSVTRRAAHRRCTVLYSSMHTPSLYCTTLYCSATGHSIPIGSRHHKHASKRTRRNTCSLCNAFPLVLYITHWSRWALDLFTVHKLAHYSRRSALNIRAKVTKPCGHMRLRYGLLEIEKALSFHKEAISWLNYIDNLIEIHGRCTPPAAAHPCTGGAGSPVPPHAAAGVPSGPADEESDTKYLLCKLVGRVQNSFLINRTFLEQS